MHAVRFVPLRGTPTRAKVRGGAGGVRHRETVPCRRGAVHAQRIGAALIDTGNGEDTVSVDSTVFGGSLRLRTGGGNDWFRCAQSEAGPVAFNGLLLADLGDGDDELLLGTRSQVDDLVAFDAPGSRIAGGRGRNTFDDDSTHIVNPANVTITDFQPV